MKYKQLTLVMILATTSAYSQSSGALSLSSGSTVAGGSVALPLLLDSGTGNIPSALQWTFSYQEGDVSSLSVSPGGSLTAASKTVTCNSTPGSTICIAAGINAEVINSGVVAVVTANISASPSHSSIPIEVGGTLGALPDGSGTSLSATGGTVTIQAGVPGTISSLACNPTSIITPGVSACTVALSASAPAGGTIVNLMSNDTSLSVPGSITVPAGSVNTIFAATAGGVGNAQTVVLTASLSGGNSMTATLTLQAPGIVPGLVAAYAFDEASGSSVFDASGNGNTGEIQGATWTTSGKYGAGLEFDGSSSLVTIPDAPLLQLSAGMTLEAWVKPASASSAWSDVIYKGDDNYFLEGTSPASGVPVGGGTLDLSNTVIYGSSDLPVDVWSHLALAFDASGLRLYVNGIQVVSYARGGQLATSSNPLQIGGDTIWGQYFKGVIDEVRVYNLALTEAQIQNDMNTPVGSSGSSR